MSLRREQISFLAHDGSVPIMEPIASLAEMAARSCMDAAEAEVLPQSDLELVANQHGRLTVVEQRRVCAEHAARKPLDDDVDARAAQNVQRIDEPGSGVPERRELCALSGLADFEEVPEVRLADSQRDEKSCDIGQHAVIVDGDDRIRNHARSMTQEVRDAPLHLEEALRCTRDPRVEIWLMRVDRNEILLHTSLDEALDQGSVLEPPSIGLDAHVLESPARRRESGQICETREERDLGAGQDQPLEGAGTRVLRADLLDQRPIGIRDACVDLALDDAKAASAVASERQRYDERVVVLHADTPDHVGRLS